MEKKSYIFLAGHNGLVGKSVLDLLRKKGYKNIITVDKKKLDLIIFFHLQRILFEFKLKKNNTVTTNIFTPNFFIYCYLLI